MKIVRKKKGSPLKDVAEGAVFEIERGSKAEADFYQMTDGGWDGHPTGQKTSVRIRDGALCSYPDGYLVVIHVDAEVYIR